MVDEGIHLFPTSMNLYRNSSILSHVVTPDFHLMWMCLSVYNLSLSHSGWTSIFPLCLYCPTLCLQRPGIDISGEGAQWIHVRSCVLSGAGKGSEEYVRKSSWGVLWFNRWNQDWLWRPKGQDRNQNLGHKSEQEVDRSRPQSVGSEEGVEVISTMELSCPVCFHWPLDAQGMVVSLPYWWKGRKDTR